MLTLSRRMYEPGESIRIGSLTQSFRLKARTGVEDEAHEGMLLKQLLPRLADDPAHVRRWLLKAQQNAALPALHSVRVYDWGASDQGAYIVVEQVAGKSLESLSRHLQGEGRTLPTEVACYIAGSILDALVPAHAQTPPLAHLDLSPTSVLVRADGTVTLTEFGMWDALPPTLVSRQRLELARVHYSAPELANSRAGDARSDLFSVGVMLFELLSGRSPFEGANQLQVALNIAAGRRISGKDVTPALDDGICDVLDMMLGHTPEERFSTAQAARAALASVYPHWAEARSALAELMEQVPMEVVPLPSAVAGLKASASGLSRKGDLSRFSNSGSFSALQLPPSLQPSPALVPPALLPPALVTPPLVFPSTSAAERPPALVSLSLPPLLSHDAVVPPPLFAPAAPADHAPPAIAPSALRTGQTSFLKRSVTFAAVDRPAPSSVPPASLLPSAPDDFESRRPEPLPSALGLADLPSAIAPSAQMQGGAYAAIMPLPVLPEPLPLPSVSNTVSHWSEPSRTLFQMKSYARAQTQRRGRYAHPLMLLLLSVAFGFALSVAIYFVIRLLD